MSTLLFDLDGTLIDSDPLHIEVFADMFKERNRPFDKHLYVTQIIGTHNTISFPKLFPGEDVETLSTEKEARFREKLGAKATPMPGSEALLAHARAQNWNIGVVTNAPRINAEHMLKAIGYMEKIDTLIIGDDCKAGKPAPDPYLAGMAYFDAKPHQTIAFEDSPTGIAAAQAAGLYTIGIASTLNKTALTKAGAQDAISDFTHLDILRLERLVR